MEPGYAARGPGERPTGVEPLAGPDVSADWGIHLTGVTAVNPLAMVAKRAVRQGFGVSRAPGEGWDFGIPAWDS